MKLNSYENDESASIKKFVIAKSFKIWLVYL